MVLILMKQQEAAIAVIKRPIMLIEGMVDQTSIEQR